MDNWAMPGNLQKSSAVLEIAERWVEEYFHKTLTQVCIDFKNI
jgi:hypothetical protein